MFKILTLNNISVTGLDRLPRDNYEIASEIGHPDAILLRSFKMHDMEIPDTLKAVGRAGAGVNNIPVEKMTAMGIPVFNTPGANANAVKELVIAAMLMASRNLTQAWEYARNLEGDDAAIAKAVEAGKKKYVGTELPGKTLGVIGLGAIGGQIANAVIALGMNVIGYDPTVTIQHAWKLSAEVERALSFEELLSEADYITFHVPLIDATRNMLNAESIKHMKKNAIVLNFARGGIVDDAAIIKALDEENLYAYINDFPTNENKNHPSVVSLPHLGASTLEAEDNCAVMVADQVRDYLENGNITNSVNFPEMRMPRAGASRIAISNSNVPKMVGQITSVLADSGINIVDMLNKSRGDIAYNLLDLGTEVGKDIADKIKKIEGVLAVRIM
ncbi:MAG: phosphoglycerate dehydrogenase [Chlorobium phaeobacteroides]|uniref:D-3-phosphoglycerate dehydrogenase n=1 Tax=Chlorobium phaeobacteroides (strain BS1) TaxID=331678 RepID=B3EK65_CHLPB|nr:phosphoglycerate dehydrogenase [Chlorobium phaeobacteroides]MBL6956718.1 phosphoglycerate dehydrogenase [Chlorobium phaeobacteroides]